MRKLLLIQLLLVWGLFDLGAQGIPGISSDCPPDTVGAYELRKYEQEAYQFLELFVTELQILIDPQTNVVQKANAKELILYRFKDRDLNVRAPSWFGYELEKTPAFRMRPTTRSLESYLDYLTERQSNSEKVNIEWCLPADTAFHFNRGGTQGNVVRASNCRYFPYSAAFPIGEVLTIESNQIPFDEYLCKSYNFELRLAYQLDTNRAEGEREFFEWVPIMSSVTEGKGGCIEPGTGACPELDRSTSVTALPDTGSNVFYFDFGPGPSRPGWTKVNKVDVLRPELLFGIRDSSKVIGSVSHCYEDGTYCDASYDEDFLILTEGWEFVLQGIANQKYQVVVWVGDPDTSVLQERFDLKVEGKRYRNLEFYKGEVKRLEYTVDVDDGRVNIEFERGDSVRITRILIRANQNYFDFGTGPVKEGYKKVDANTLYSDASGFGIVRSGDIAQDVQGVGSDSLLSDYSSFSQKGQFKINVPRGVYEVSIYTPGRFQAKVRGEVVEVPAGGATTPFSTRIKVGTDEEMKFIFQDDLSSVSAIELRYYEVCELKVPVWKYAVPGLALDHIRHEMGNRRGLVYPTSGAVLGLGIHAYIRNQDAAKYLRISRNTKVIDVLNESYREYQRAERDALISAGSGAVIWLGTGIWAFILDNRQKNRCVENRDAAGESVGKTTSLQPSVQFDPLGGAYTGLSFKVKL